MKASQRTENERVIYEKEITDKYFENEIPVTETITERIIEHDPDVNERAKEELRQAEAEHRARSDPSETGSEIENDYGEAADKEVWDDYERKVNQEVPKAHRTETPKENHRPTIEDRMEGEQLPEKIEGEKSPEEPKEILEEISDNIPKEQDNEIDVEIPEIDIDLSESDEIGSEIE
jgi:hypothetical protein